ncbi:hypothetical protein M0R04_08315 [Candidatus Dojkabacteria bacterium]|jgi:hypothetical protein|nr:hypothetical protein [Candidatus Dojkabacteria bacterium]
MKTIDGERKLEGLLNDNTAGWYAKPTLDDIESLQIGDLVPTCFGRLSPVTSISYRGVSIHGKAYVGYYQQFGENSTISGSMTENEYIATVPMTAKYNRRENYPAR